MWHMSVCRVSRSFAAAIAGALLLATLLAGVGVAEAHTGATGSSPADGATVQTSPGQVAVTFNENLRPEFAHLTVVGPDRNFYQQGQAAVEGNTVSVPVNSLGPAGKYEINFRVTSADGHVVQGQRTFTLAVAGDGAPGEQAAPDDSFTNSEHGLAWWAWVLIGLAIAVVVAAAVVLLLRRRRS